MGGCRDYTAGVAGDEMTPEGLGSAEVDHERENVVVGAPAMITEAFANAIATRIMNRLCHETEGCSHRQRRGQRNSAGSGP